MLLNLPNAGDPSGFNTSELFKKCRDLGIIPRSEKDLEESALLKSVSRMTRPSSLESADEQDSIPLDLIVEGMWCPACAWLIENTLLKIPGVAHARCVFSTDRVQCRFHPVQTSPAEIIRAISHLGYSTFNATDAAGDKYKKTEMLRLIISALLTVNVMMLSFALYTGFFSYLEPETIKKLSLPAFLMASIVLFYGGKNIYTKALAGVRQSAFSMETLITVGAFSAYLYSLLNMLSDSLHVYFDTASMLITLVLIGKTLEGSAKKSLQEDLSRFLSLQPVKARIYTDAVPNGRYVAIEHLVSGDVFMVEPAEIVPADGLILEGAGTVDESSLTGEAKPVEKKSGHMITSGTTVVSGWFHVRTAAAGENSTLGQMVNIIRDTLSQKTTVEVKTDRILHWFIPGILILALSSAILCLYYGLSTETAVTRAITVLVIACPCSLGIAIPLAHVAGVSVSRSKGILIRNFKAFEQIPKISAFVFDKTGTITTGRWMLHKVIPLDSFSKDKALSIAASLEKNSDHPIAIAIRREVKRFSLLPVAVVNTTHHGNGISAYCNQAEVKLGSKEFLEKEIRRYPDLSNILDREDQSLYSTVYMSYDRRLCSIFLLGDRIRPDAEETLGQLKTLGFSLSLVSGDGVGITRETGSRTHIDNISGGMLPRDKARFIKSLQEKGHCVAMVGDGINDALALTQADLAIGVHGGSQLSRETADITFMKEGLSVIIDLLDMAKQVNRKIRQNLAWAFLYNSISIPLAVSGVLTPLIAVTAMLLSSMSVIGNTMLLARKRNH